jgi:hypothetical protein
MLAAMIQEAADETDGVNKASWWDLNQDDEDHV